MGISKQARQNLDGIAATVDTSIEALDNIGYQSIQADPLGTLDKVTDVILYLRNIRPAILAVLVELEGGDHGSSN